MSEKHTWMQFCAQMKRWHAKTSARLLTVCALFTSETLQLTRYFVSCDKYFTRGRATTCYSKTHFGSITYKLTNTGSKQKWPEVPDCHRTHRLIIQPEPKHSCFDTKIITMIPSVLTAASNVKYLHVQTSFSATQIAEYSWYADVGVCMLMYSVVCSS